MKIRQFCVALGVVGGLIGLVAACGQSNTPANSEVDSSTNDAGGPYSSNSDGATHEFDGGTSGSDDGSTVATNDAATEDAGPSPLTVPASTWTWVDFPDAVCDDGTPTGIGIWPSATTDKLAFFFAGGGACWDYDSCVTNVKSVHGPFGATQWAAQSSGNFPGWIIDHADADNPLKDYTTVFVPYCTSDLHGGDNVITYTSGADAGADAGGPKTFYHKGRANVAAYLKRLAATYPSPSSVVVSGSSAGGGGALLSYDAIRKTWPSATSYLIDDSLPFLEKDSIPAAMRQAWFANWNLNPLTTPLCGPGCQSDMSALFPGIAALYPHDRMALVEWTTDAVIAAYFQINYLQYWSHLKDFTNNELLPIGHFNHFYIDAWGHTTLTDVKKHTGLETWLTQMVTGDAAWNNHNVGPF